MNILYVRVSSLKGQKTDRQRVNENRYDWVVEDKCSGAIPFFERPGGKEILKHIEKGTINKLTVWSLDRLGRDLLNVLQTINFCSKKAIPIEFVSQGLITIDEEGKENPISKMVISILGVLAEMRRKQILEAQAQGIAIAKAKGDVYFGRKPGTKEDTLKFLSKPNNAKALELIKKGYKGIEVARIVNIHPNTVTKIKRIGIINLNARRDDS